MGREPGGGDPVLPSVRFSQFPGKLTFYGVAGLAVFPIFHETVVLWPYAALKTRLENNRMKMREEGRERKGVRYGECEQTPNRTRLPALAGSVLPLTLAVAM